MYMDEKSERWNNQAFHEGTQTTRWGNRKGKRLKTKIETGNGFEIEVSRHTPIGLRMIIKVRWPKGEICDDAEAEQLVKCLTEHVTRISFGGQVVMNKDTLHTLLNREVKDLPLPTRIKKTLLTKKDGDLSFRRFESFQYLGELVQKKPLEVWGRPGLSPQSMMQIKQALTALDLCFGMDVMGWQPPAE